jgi:NADH-quinone oxidoreductase subunit N
MTLGAFAVITVASTPEAGRDADALADFDGLFWRRPALAASFAVMLLSLAGIPMTLGFIAKFYLFSAGVEGRMWVLLWALIVGSGIGLFYYLRIIFAMTRHPEIAGGPSSVAVGSLADRTVLVALAVVVLALGIYPMPLIDFVRGAIASFGMTTALLGAP